MYELKQTFDSVKHIWTYRVTGPTLQKTLSLSIPDMVVTNG